MRLERSVRYFSTLDALRGVAAIGVMLWHTPWQPLPITGGYLMVDLFFELSGFVMALTYEDRLRQGMSRRHFMALRAARLWPMIALATLLCMVILNAWIGMAFLLPDVRSLLLPDPLATRALFPGDPPLWSLLMEVAAYLGFAWAAPRLTTRQVAAVTLASGIALSLTAAMSADIGAYGSYWSTVPQGLVRVSYSFSFGVLIYRLRALSGLPRIVSSRSWFLLGPVAAIAFLVPLHGRLPAMLVILVLLPAVLWFATKWEVPQTRLAAGLSSLSYPLYCIHMPLLWLWDSWGVSVVVMWPAVIVLSLVLDRWCDRPACRLLRKKFEAQPWCAGKARMGDGIVAP